MDLISEAPVALDAEGGDHGPAEIVAGAVLAARAGRRKPGASLVVAAGLVADGRAGAMVSSGPTGAVVAAAMLGLGRLPGVQRPALAVVLPVPGAPTVLLDAGASTDVTPAQLAQYARMGAAYATLVLDIADPRIG